ncbi:serine hydroxymethyltransferase [bacterium]|nr:serine hydroxymethyltransferase [bacterium]
MNKKDQHIFDLIEQEKKRQEEQINLIASENYAPTEILQATASVLTNKYAEGYPGKRYYAGCEHIDAIEQLAIDRCKKLFNAQHANVQPHSGSQANMAVYFAMLEPGDTILGMGLREGGHLTHGHKVNFSGKLFKQVQYLVHPETQRLDYDEINNLAQKHKPKLIIAGASAYSRIIDFQKFAKIAKSVDALLMADIAHIAGLIAAGVHPNPFPHADFVTTTTHKTLRGPRGGVIMCKQKYAAAIDKSVMPGTQGGPIMNTIAAKAVAFKFAMEPSFKIYQQQVIKNSQALAHALQKRNYNLVSSGSDNHLFIVDLRSKNISGLQAERYLEQAGITVSRSCIPFDPAKPWITSGIRLGTPAITTRGMQEQDMKVIAELIDEVINSEGNETILKNVQEKSLHLCKNFPLQ